MPRKKKNNENPSNANGLGKNEKVLLVDSEGKVITLSHLPKRVPIFPAFQRPIFPGILTMVGSSKAMSAPIKKAINRANNVVGLLMVNPEKYQGNHEMMQVETSDQFYLVGTVAYVLHWVELPDKSCQFMMSTLQRFRVLSMQKEGEHFMAEVEYLETPPVEMTDQLKARGAAIVSAIKELIPHNPIFSQEMNYLLSQVDINDPATLADLAASVTNAKGVDLQQIMETVDLQERLERTLLLLREEYDLSLLKEKISQKIEEKVSKHQREFFLREQLKAIKMELGLEQDRKSLELQRFRERFEQLKLSEEAQLRAKQEMERYELLDEQSPETHVVHQYLDWMAALPWGIYSKDRLSLNYAERILNQDHYGLKDVKKRIVEFIGVSKLKGSVKGAILCLAGPPGVGKTSLGKSIAKALGREFYRFSVGGMHDESELKGHRRTYIGSMPGRIISALKQSKTSNPVILLDELDKIGQSYRGDPFSVLLEVLDPQQNEAFLDHYLDVRYDLSNVLFIATANVTDTIPAALLDRMEVLRLSGYILEEKIEIAKRHLLPKVLSESGLTPKDLVFEAESLKKIVQDYAREAGVRSFEKQLRAIARTVATEHARGRKKAICITPDLLEKYLGLPIFSDELYHDRDVPGVARGLAWTSLGGTTLYIEATQLFGPEGTLKLTGQLGDVMRESSTIAHSYIQSILPYMSNRGNFLKKNAVHLHVPAGATPKDGPSAGIAMASSLLSLALERPISKDLAMTGEITLTGYVLPVGGIKEKIIGAKQAGIHNVVMPKANQKEYAELPNHLKKGMTTHFVSHFSEVATLAFGVDLPH